MSGRPLLEARGLEFRFGARAVLRGLSLDLRRGESLALFGPNGSGKTTLLRILATLIRPHAGEMLLDGAPLSGRGAHRRQLRRVGFLSHQTMLYDRLTARENLLFYARMYGVREKERRCAELLELAELSGREDDPVMEYSRGMQQRLALSRAILHDPDVVLLDEPFSGLDPRASERLGGLLGTLAGRGKAILFTSHDLGAGRAADRAAILARGTLIFQATRDQVASGALASAYGALAGHGV